MSDAEGGSPTKRARRVAPYSEERSEGNSEGNSEEYCSSEGDSEEYLRSIDQEDRYVKLAVRTEEEAELRQDLYQICVRLFFPFQSKTFKSGECKAGDIPDSFLVDVVHGGITNKLYRCQDPLVCEKYVLVRIFGAKTDVVINREREAIVVNALSRLGEGPTIYGRFLNGRLEEFLPGRTLSPADMKSPNIMILNASATARLHALDIPIIKDCGLFPMFRGWVKTALELRFEDAEKAAKYEALDMKKIASEAADLLKILSKERSRSKKYVYSHNDLLGGNIMYVEAKTPSTPASCRFIDFEYGCYTSREYDIANHFCECCGMECNWSLFPSEQLQKFFIQHYLFKSGLECSGEAVDHFYTGVQPWILLAHLFWGIWAVIQASISLIDFDYLAYAKMRFQGYREMKHKCLKQIMDKQETDDATSAGNKS
eukprot:gb/GEZN01009237.1/.p1 GENE.gb/GEZN01009237.1/~~gb/GEZN01009237.1/.p1  ORF type:complete len:428 (-),score=32.20 gb/GEZN01009237.1/:43-1326(-)